jgi:radical SAM protein with 4Fe4S-binding SPASM domain
MSQYKYNSADLVRPVLLDPREEFLLKDSKTFCIYPWIHLHAYPTGEAYPCCHAEMGVGQVGNCRNNTLEEIWNSPEQRKLRTDMLSETANPACARCYEQEESGFFSGRRSANKHHGHNIGRVMMTEPDGRVNHFGMTYWDIRFSNLCNLSCRSCGHIFSSSWYQDQVALAGPDWKAKNKPLNFAGRTEIDMWEQLLPHLDYVEQIYFAGGEPLMMDEHYRILEELERRQRFDVRLIYNTNFTHVKLKNRLVFDYWKKFKSVAVGASLDAMGARAEYIRKGTDWDTVVRNRAQMLEICPNVDFYISPTLSILNAWHLPDFHWDWVQRGFIRPQDLNVNILQDPSHYRIDIAPHSYKLDLKEKFENHLKWLREEDQLQRATVGFESAINFMMSTDNTALLPKFWEKTRQLDAIRNETVLDVLPELSALL